MPFYIQTQRRKTSFWIYKYLRAYCAPVHYRGLVALRTSVQLLHRPRDYFLRKAAPVEKAHLYSLINLYSFFSASMASFDMVRLPYAMPRLYVLPAKAGLIRIDL